jgi:filamentous hemagglutinin
MQASWQAVRLRWMPRTSPIAVPSFTEQLTMNADTLFNTGNTAGITANQSAAFHLDTALHNTNGATIFMGNKDTALTIHTSSLDNSGVIVSGGNLAVNAQTIQSSGTLGAGVQSDGTLGTDGDLVLQASGNVIATGKNLAAGSIDVTAQDINLAGAKTGAGKDVKLTATSGDINHTGAVLQATGAITLQAENAVHNDKDNDGKCSCHTGKHHYHQC